MIALSVVAAGVIAIAAVLFVRPSFEGTSRRIADQRGITLQTLIVTAVLVLMAVAAGVVIVAITNSARDDLQGQTPNTDARCEPWEIFDQTLAAAGRGGGDGGIGSSGEGCLRVCYVRASNQDNNIGAADEIRPPGTAAGATVLQLVMSRSNIANDNTAAASKTNTLVVSDSNELAATNTAENPDSAVALDTLDVGSGTTAGTGDVDFDDDNMIIKVADNQRYCHVWNTTTDEEIVRSSRE